MKDNLTTKLTELCDSYVKESIASEELRLAAIKLFAYADEKDLTKFALSNATKDGEG